MNKNSLISFCLLIALAFAYLPLCAMKADKKVYEPDFFKSLVSGPIEELEKFVDEAGDVHAYDSEGKTLLAYSYFQQNPKAGTTLLSNGASFDKFIHVHDKYESILGLLLHIDIPEEERWVEVENLVVNKCVDPNKLFVDGDSPLEYVVRTKMDKKYVSLLIEAGARVDRVSDLKTSPLWWAIQNSLHEHTHLLLKAGAPADYFRWTKNKTPLGLACIGADLKMMEILLQSGANPNAISDGMTPLGRAVVHNDVAAMKLLLAHRASLHVPISSDGLLPLPYALSSPVKKEIVELLLKAGANPNSTYSTESGRKRSMLYLSVFKCVPALKLLLEHGAHVNHQDERGNTILHYAAKAEKTDEIGVLLEFGASKTIPNHKRKTPVQSAPEGFRVIFQNMQTRLKASKKIDLSSKSISQ